jgi:large subunit ribosomal protein L35
MAKLKTRKNAAKRFEFTATGKMLRAKHGVGHLRTHKSKRTLAQVDKKLPVDKADVKRLSRLLPYGA